MRLDDLPESGNIEDRRADGGYGGGGGFGSGALGETWKGGKEAGPFTALRPVPFPRTRGEDYALSLAWGAAPWTSSLARSKLIGRPNR